MYCNTLICVLYSKAFSNKVTETFWVKLQTDGEQNWFMERVFLWRLEARVWSGQRDGWGCLFGVELAGGGEREGGRGAPTRCVIGVHTKTDASGHGPASFPPDRLSSAQEWDTDTSSRLRHIIWACQGLYQAGSSGALGLSPQPPHRQRDTCTRIPSTHPCPRRRIACRGSGVGWGSVAALHCPDWKLR